MKKIFSLVCAFILLLTCAAFTALQSGAAAFDGWYDKSTGFMYYDGSIVGYTKVEDDIVIPSSLHGLNIDGVYRFWFYPLECANKYVNVSADDDGTYNSFEEMQQKADDADTIQPVFDSGIHDGVIYQYKSVIRKITLSEGITRIYGGAFKDFTALEEVVLPSTLVSIGDEAFSGCTRLKTINLPGKLSSIGKSAFEGCASLESVSIPSNVTKLGDKAFSGCSKLNSVKLPHSVQYAAIKAFDSYDQLAGKKQTVDGLKYTGTILTGYEKIPENGSISIQKDTTMIGDRAFEKCTELTEAVIPENVTCIGDEAFGECTALKTIVFPDSVSDIGSNVLGSCKKDVTTVYADPETPAAVYAAELGLTVKPVKEYYGSVQNSLSSGESSSVSDSVSFVGGSRPKLESKGGSSEGSWPWFITLTSIILIIVTAGVIIVIRKRKNQ